MINENEATFVAEEKETGAILWGRDAPPEDQAIRAEAL